MKKFTADDIIAFNPCWLKEPGGEQRIRDLVASNGGSVNVIDVLLCNEISDEDAIWLAARFATPQQSRLAAVLFAEITLDAEVDAGRTPDPRSFAAVEVAKRHAIGQATNEELKKACNNAWDAYENASIAACSNAWTVARAAAYRAAAAARAAYVAISAADGAAAGVADIACIASRATSYTVSRELFFQVLLDNDGEYND